MISGLRGRAPRELSEQFWLEFQSESRKAVAKQWQAVHRMGDGRASSPPVSPHQVRGRLRRRDCESSSSDDSSFEDEAEGQIAESAERPQTRPGQSQAGALHVAGAGPAVKEFYVDDEVDVQIAGNWFPAVVVAKSGSGRHAEYTCRTKELNEKKSRNRLVGFLTFSR